MKSIIIKQLQYFADGADGSSSHEILSALYEITDSIDKLIDNVDLGESPGSSSYADIVNKHERGDISCSEALKTMGKRFRRRMEATDGTKFMTVKECINCAHHGDRCMQRLPCRECNEKDKFQEINNEKD